MDGKNIKTTLRCLFVYNGFISWSFTCHRGGQGSGAGDGHRVQPISESTELLHRRVSASSSAHPELRAFD